MMFCICKENGTCNFVCAWHGSPTWKCITVKCTATLHRQCVIQTGLYHLEGVPVTVLTGKVLRLRPRSRGLRITGSWTVTHPSRATQRGRTEVTAASSDHTRWARMPWEDVSARGFAQRAPADHRGLLIISVNADPVLPTVTPDQAADLPS